MTKAHSKITILAFSLFLLFSNNNQAQVVEKNLQQHVKELSSEKFEGRSLNSDGIRYAEKYILNTINNLELNPINGSYRQEFTILKNHTISPTKPKISYKNSKYNYPDDFYTIKPNFIESCKYPIYKTDIQPLNNEDIDYAILLNDKSEIKNIQGIHAKIILTPTFKKADYTSIVNSNLKGIFTSANTDNYITCNSKTIIYLSPTTTKKISSSLNSRKTQYITLPCLKSNNINTANIYGMIPGKYADSTIVISAHYDHIGIRNNKLNPGANDNASGVSSVLEIAKVLTQETNTPKYNILFALFSAEESGLLGSDFFIKNFPFEKETIVANINLDMIGNKDSYHEKEPNFIYTYGPKNSQFLTAKIDSLNNLKSYLKLDYFKHDIEMGNRFLRMSDQASFMKVNIPVLFIFNGLSPNYHKPEDTYDKLDYSKMKNVCNLTIDLIKEIAY